MKTLVVQLARYGDIVLTWPLLEALRRQGDDVHLLVRKRYSSITDAFRTGVSVWKLDTRHILEPLVGIPQKLSDSLNRQEKLLQEIKNEKFDRIVNLSFSPYSSHLLRNLEGELTKVSGYTRDDEGFLSIPDDSSAYFFAQVGVGKYNRVHLQDIFSSIVDVDLVDTDFECLRDDIERDESLNFPEDPFVVLHLGSSQVAKTYGAFKWRQVLRGLRREWGGSVVLIGSPEEQTLAQEVLEGGDIESVFNWVGKTKISQLFPIISQARILVGADSLPMQVSSLTSTPCLNLSFASVNFWETGPRNQGSRIILAEDPESLPSDRVVDEILAMLKDSDSGYPVIVPVQDRVESFIMQNSEDDSFPWELIQALYMEGDYPRVKNELTLLGLQRLYEAVQVGVEQMSLVLDPQRKDLALEILDQIDQIILQVEKFVPSLQPLISWFQTQRVRIKPGSVNEVWQDTFKIFSELRLVLSVYALPNQEESNQLEMR